ncbi:hypothetical protein GOV12_05205 [Candidatus Pacearchaeota archaeon]|nr:hypothetical protein [Candidatus Pacearchaeota archaeon]
MENCVRCKISSEKVNLFDAVYEGRMENICERCSIIENVPIIKKPDPEVLKEAEESNLVRDRLSKIKGDFDNKRKEPVDDYFSRKKKLKEIDDNPKLELPLKERLNLIKNYHWEIMKNRRRKGHSFKQLGMLIGESETLLELIEKGKLPEGSESVIRKLEQYFQVNLRNVSEALEFLNRKNKEVLKTPILLDDEGCELLQIPEPEIEIIENEDDEDNLSDDILSNNDVSEIIGEERKDVNESFYDKKEISEKKFSLGRPWRRGYKNDEVPEIKEIKNEEVSEKFVLKRGDDLNLNSVNSSRVTIKDLQEIHKNKIEASKEEKRQEQKKIEERERLIEAKKEELILMKEKESRDVDNYLGGSELFRKKEE